MSSRPPRSRTAAAAKPHPPAAVPLESAPVGLADSILDQLLARLPHLRPQLYFKASLTALSHAMEDLVLSGSGSGSGSGLSPTLPDTPLLVASFQQERFYRQESRRYHKLAQHSDRIYVLAAPETEFRNASGEYETVAFAPEDMLSNEWHLVVAGERYAACLICAERSPLVRPGRSPSTDDRVRRFEGIWTFDRHVTRVAAELLLARIRYYRPELASKLDRDLSALACAGQAGPSEADPEPFAQRLVTYLQAGQYKLLKAYRSIAAQERKERSINSIVTAIRQSLDPEATLNITARELGSALRACRCLVYRCAPGQSTVHLAYEALGSQVSSLAGQVWPVGNNPLFSQAVAAQAPVWVADIATLQTTNELAHHLGQPPLDPAADLAPIRQWASQWGLVSWAIVPVRYRDKLLGAIELHHCGVLPRLWSEEELSLVEAIATQLGAALMQAQAYADLENLNGQLAALDRTRNNLIAITGHELRTPLSTIRVCLESLASEPEMPAELRQIMLETAIDDAERLRGLVQDFLTLSQLESGRVKWAIEAVSLEECVELALSSLRARFSLENLPKIVRQLPENLPPARADGEWLVELLVKLLDNACKFTPASGSITVAVVPQPQERTIRLAVCDTGRGIEPDRLEVVFDRFYQEEGSLRRTVGGTGLGLAICRQIARGLGGDLRAESAGKDRGSQFYVTLPLYELA